MAVISFKPKQVTKRLLGTLQDRAHDIIINRYGLGDDVDTKTLEAIRQSLVTQFPNNVFKVLKEDKIGPKIGAELRTNAIYAIFSAMLIIMIYVGFRFQFIYGVAGVIALFHDVIATFGAIVLLNGLSPYLHLEIDQNIMAAFLTLVGFSINDTVVVFDRIRENLKSSQIGKSEHNYESFGK